MDLSLIADMADVFAAIGVIGSLIFLATQIRQNTTQVKNTHLQSSHALMASHQSRIQNAYVATVVQKGLQSYSDLGEAEKLSFSSWVHEALLVTDNFLRLGMDKVLSPGLHEMGEQRVNWLFAFPGVREWYLADDREPLPSSPVKAIADSILRL